MEKLARGAQRGRLFQTMQRRKGRCRRSEAAIKREYKTVSGSFAFKLKYWKHSTTGWI
jgi:hypothetical protein